MTPLFIFTIQHPPSSSLFPYTTLFRSRDIVDPATLRIGGDDGKVTALDKAGTDRKSTRLNSSHTVISYAVFCLKKKAVMAAEVVEQALTDPARQSLRRRVLGREQHAVV